MTCDLTEKIRRARAMTPDSMRAAAELHMLDVLGVPPHLLPPAVAGTPLHPFAVLLRKSTIRRVRLLHRLLIAADNLRSQAVAIAEHAADGAAPAARYDLNRHDVDAVATVTAMLRDLDAALAADVDALRAAAEVWEQQHPRPAEPWERPPTA